MKSLKTIINERVSGRDTVWDSDQGEVIDYMLKDRRFGLHAAKFGYEDSEFWLNALKNGYQIVAVYKPLYSSCERQP